MSHDVCPQSDLISQGFGCTDNPFEWPAPWCSAGRYHAGIDLGWSPAGPSLEGAPVYATRPGVVVAVGADGQGNVWFSQYLGPWAVCYEVLDGSGVYLLHGHLAGAAVALGQRLRPGDLIGRVGSLGASTGPHLHLEARRDGAYQGVRDQAVNVLDPGPYLDFAEASAMDQATFNALLAGNQDFVALIWRVKALLDCDPAVLQGPTQGEPNALSAKLAELESKITAGGGAPQRLTGTVTLTPG